MDSAELQRKIAAGEDTRLELKSVAHLNGALPRADQITKALCAFANTAGGELVLGVESDGTPSGIGGREAADRLQLHVSQLAEHMDPSLSVVQRLVEVDGQRVLVVSVRGYLAGRPFSTSRTGKYFVRDGNRSREATKSELERLFASTARVTADEEVLEETSLDADLDRDAALTLFAQVESDFRPEHLDAYLAAAHCVEDGHLTVTGALLFSREPQRHVRGAEIRALRFAGTEPSTDTLASEEIRGTVPRQIEKALAFIAAQVPAASSRQGPRRAVRAPSVPTEVWVEAITNAVSHRDYRSASATRLFVLDDRVELMNPGELLNKLTIESLRIFGTQQQRNPNLASVLARSSLYRDKAGIGIPDMYRRLKAAGLPEPKIEIVGGDFRLTIYTRPLA